MRVLDYQEVSLFEFRALEKLLLHRFGRKLRIADQANGVCRTHNLGWVTRQLRSPNDPGAGSPPAQIEVPARAECQPIYSVGQTEHALHGYRKIEALPSKRSHHNSQQASLIVSQRSPARATSDWRGELQQAIS